MAGRVPFNVDARRRSSSIPVKSQRGGDQGGRRRNGHPGESDTERPFPERAEQAERVRVRGLRLPLTDDESFQGPTARGCRRVAERWHARGAREGGCLAGGEKGLVGDDGIDLGLPRRNTCDVAEKSSPKEFEKPRPRGGCAKHLTPTPIPSRECRNGRKGCNHAARSCCAHHCPRSSLASSLLTCLRSVVVTSFS